MGLVNFHHTKRRARPSPREAWRSPHSARRFFRWDLAGFPSDGHPDPYPQRPERGWVLVGCPKGVGLGWVGRLGQERPECAGRPTMPEYAPSARRRHGARPTPTGPHQTPQSARVPQVPTIPRTITKSTHKDHQTPARRAPVHPGCPPPAAPRRKPRVPRDAGSGTGARDAHGARSDRSPSPACPWVPRTGPQRSGHRSHPPSPHGTVPGTARPEVAKVPGRGVPALPGHGRAHAIQVPMGHPGARGRGTPGAGTRLRHRHGRGARAATVCPGAVSPAARPPLGGIRPFRNIIAPRGAPDPVGRPDSESAKKMR